MQHHLWRSQTVRKKNDEEFGSNVIECNEMDVAAECLVLAATSLVFCDNSAINNTNNNNNNNLQFTCSVGTFCIFKNTEKFFLMLIYVYCFYR